MLYNVGHFVAAEDGVGVFALPNAFHVEMAEPHLEEVAAALSKHLGRAVSVRLVADRGTGEDTPATARDDPASEDDASSVGRSTDGVELDSLDDVGDAVGDETAPIPTGAEWATDRLRAAFPGAEEVST
jgi:hypothetical protein